MEENIYQSQNYQMNLYVPKWIYIASSELLSAYYVRIKILSVDNINSVVVRVGQPNLLLVEDPSDNNDNIIELGW